jgi:hypothetical protein
MVVMESLAELLFNDFVTIFALVRGFCSMDDEMMKSRCSNLQGFTAARTQDFDSAQDRSSE